MPLNDTESTNKSPLSLSELFSLLKKKVRDTLNIKGIDDKEFSECDMPVISCACANNDKNYVADITIYCENCSSILFKEVIKHPYKIAALLFILTYGVSQFIDYAITDNRYPLDIEYALLDACTNSNSELSSKFEYVSKRNICLCALEDTMNEVSYVLYEIDENSFFHAFKKYIEKCN